MDKKTFRKKIYFRLLQIIFPGIFIFFIILGIWGIFYEEDMLLVAFFYAGIVAIIYWFTRRIIPAVFRDKL